jgi:outer membrane protein W
MRRLLSTCVLAMAIGFVAASPASAQQSVNLFIGAFTPRALDARGTSDVLFQDGTFLVSPTSSSGINISDFNGATIGGEYLVALGRNFEGGLGIGFYQRTVSTVYTNFVDTNGNDVAQDLKLRIIPFTATVRFLPLGHEAFQPYIGAGVGVNVWRYSETGQFIDNNNNVFVGNFVGSGSQVGPVVLGGLRFAMGGFAPGFEVRWQGGTANLPADQGFAGTKIDLGGVNYLFTLNFKF